MDFTSLEIFKTVVDAGGIIAAARQLHRVPSGVTTRIKQLEATLGVELFLREQRRLTLSPAGELFLGYVEQLLRLAEQARQAVHGDMPRGVLRIGTLESTAASRLPLLLALYHEKYPAVRVELATHTTDALVEGVFRRQFDAAFVAGRAEASGLETLVAFDEELVIVAPRAHPAIDCAQDVRTDTIISFPHRLRLSAPAASLAGIWRRRAREDPRIGLVSCDYCVCRLGDGYRTRTALSTGDRARQ